MDSAKENDLKTIVLDHVSWDQPNAASEIFISDFDTMITTITPASTPTFTIGNGTSWNWNADTITLGDPQPSGTITLRGEDADIDINGVRLMETLRGIQERLNILTPDPDMEQEWSELAEIRKQYEEKLAECRSKSRVWKALKS